MTKFKAGKMYRNTTKCGNYESVHELMVEEVKGNTISGYISYYGILNGQRLDSFKYNIFTKVRKANGEDYQITTDLIEVYKAIDEVKEI
jgi:hypothetical protein